MEGRGAPSRSPTALAGSSERRQLMSNLEWILGTTLAILYLFLIFTVALITFRKGHYVLGILGIFLPFLWLIGAVLPDRNEDGITATM
jgi:uncharacterized membrane protein